MYYPPAIHTIEIRLDSEPASDSGRDGHETFQAEMEKKLETHKSEIETRPRCWAFCPR